jgi:hypothetical protein
MVLVVSGVLGIRALDAAGLLTATNGFLAWMGSSIAFRTTTLTLSWLPLWLTLLTYQRHAVNRLRWWECPAYCALFAVYVYLWALATLRAWARFATGRGNWVKTPRTPVGEGVGSSPSTQRDSQTASRQSPKAAVLTDA